ncbi:placenta growth factor isoform X3 [Chrysemys picta bellii]|uniref:placenta growth factor isoform X3 n=1 Tax=Chrysemys picta bellii TaxID=8478 RepID=UPI001C67CCD0|nr:placenta growth factor isoform X3 [Chrysemys picta bellii]
MYTSKCPECSTTDLSWKGRVPCGWVGDAGRRQWDRFSRNSTSEGQVLPFQEVWGRSFCRPLEMLVDIVSEYPSEVEHMFSPSCISLQRCTGCCGDETLQCVPVETANVTMQASAGYTEVRKEETQGPRQEETREAAT